MNSNARLAKHLWLKAPCAAAQSFSTILSRLYAQPLQCCGQRSQKFDADTCLAKDSRSLAFGRRRSVCVCGAGERKINDLFHVGPWASKLADFRWLLCIGQDYTTEGNGQFQKRDLLECALRQTNQRNGQPKGISYSSDDDSKSAQLRQQRKRCLSADLDKVIDGIIYFPLLPRVTSSHPISESRASTINRPCSCLEPIYNRKKISRSRSGSQQFEFRFL